MRWFVALIKLRTNALYQTVKTINMAANTIKP